MVPSLRFTTQPALSTAGGRGGQGSESLLRQICVFGAPAAQFAQLPAQSTVIVYRKPVGGVHLVGRFRARSFLSVVL
jgi:hypothetical protein